MDNKNIWKKRFGEILYAIFYTYNLNYDKCSKECNINSSTIRYWFKGKYFPRKDTWDLVKVFLKENIIHNEERDCHIKHVISNQFNGDDMDIYCKIDKSSNSIDEFVYNILNYCIYDGHKHTSMNDKRKKYTATGKTKAVIFDFDGTLTIGKTNRTTWESIWVSLGYKVEDCQKLHKKFSNNRINHTQWCDLTEKKFKAKKLHKRIVDAVAKSIQLLPGVLETFMILKENDIKVYIVSGSIMTVIQNVMGDLVEYIEEIKANQFLFDEDGFLERIVETKYDFEGKSKYIEEIAEKLCVSTEDVFFIGNSINDQYAWNSGAKTLCINPKFTNIYDDKVWNYYIEECNNLKDILTIINV